MNAPTVPDRGLHVVFGTGPVGLAVIDELAARGKRVRAVNRSGQAQVPAGVEVVAGDATSPVNTRDICRQATHVYNCTNAPYHQWPERFPPLQAGVLEGAAANQAKLIVMENLYMYGPNGGQPLTETHPLNGQGARGRTRQQMAEDLFAAHRSGRVRVVSARAADFFGPNVLESAAGERLFASAQAGKSVQWLGNADAPHSFTYMPDIGKALALLGERDEALGQTWHIPTARAITPREFITLVGRESGVEAKISALKKSPARAVVLAAMGLFIPPLRGYGEVLYQFDEPFVLDSSRFETTFGLQPTPLDQAVRSTVAWFRQRAH